MALDPNRTVFIDQSIQNIAKQMNDYGVPREDLPPIVALIRELVEPDPGDVLLLVEGILMWRRSQKQHAAAVLQGRAPDELSRLARHAANAERLMMVIIDRVEEARDARGPR